MHNFLLIARREFLERVRSRTFLLMTIFIPFLMFGVVALPTLLMTRYGGATRHLVIVAPDAQTAQLIREEIEGAGLNAGRTGQPAGAEERNGRPSPMVAEVDTNVSAAEREALTERVRSKEIDGVIWATPEAIKARKVDFITSEVSNLVDNAAVERRVDRALQRRFLMSKSLSSDDVTAALKPTDVTPLSPFATGSHDPENTFLAALLLTMVLYVSTLLYGVNVMRAVLEEKTSRVMEVMLSTATPKEMMAGKIFGVGAVGLAQIGIWTIAGAILGGGPMAASGAGLKGLLSLKVGLFFPIFFLLGYILYSTLCAAVGSMVNSEQEAQQMQILVMMPMILAAIILVNIIQHPSNPLAFWASLFPLTSPLIMFTRIVLEPSIPAWQIGLSLGLLLVTIYALLVLCGRIYRVGVLMYGKKPTLPEILKWIRYA